MPTTVVMTIMMTMVVVVMCPKLLGRRVPDSNDDR